MAVPRTKKKTTATPREDKNTKGESCCEFSVDERRVRLGRENLLSEELTLDIAETFRMIAHPTRVKMIRALAAGEMCVCEISEVIGLSISATSHQLHLLRSLRLVRSRAEGKQVYYFLQDSFVLALLEDCVRHVAAKGGRR
ncbi:MAG TPA: metalloregulator ArsR/SmtB family transcription factor [bacterium]|nr:metalloregulator ArsR/SmtB family transcription factor [bacterium]